MIVRTCAAYGKGGTAVGAGTEDWKREESGALTAAIEGLMDRSATAQTPDLTAHWRKAVEATHKRETTLPM